MDDFLNKTNELAGLVSTLQQQGEDNSDLRGIIAQLQAAVAKRNPPGTSEESTPMIFEAKIEPVEPAIQVPAAEEWQQERQKIFEVALMELVRTYRCLYDKTEQSFRSRRAKEQGWTEIAEKLNTTISNAQRKYANIRSSFARYLRSSNPPSGPGSVSMALKPEYEHLRWLISHIEHRGSFCKSGMPVVFQSENCTLETMRFALSEDEEIEHEKAPSTPVTIHLESPQSGTQYEYGDCDTEVPYIANTAIQKRIVSASDKRTISLENENVFKKIKADRLECHTQSPMKDSSKVEDEDEFSSFGSTIALRIRKFTPYQRSVAMGKIMNILTDVEFGPANPPSMFQAMNIFPSAARHL